MPDGSFVVTEGDPEAPLLLLCEHAGCALPPEVGTLGLEPCRLRTHWGWDPGALDVMLAAGRTLGIGSVHSVYSRLLIDLNRTLASPDLFRAELEPGRPVPGNVGISEGERRRRIEQYYEPYHRAVDDAIRARLKGHPHITIICVHSFTPKLSGPVRAFDVGLLFDGFEDLVRKVQAGFQTRGFRALLNQPYSGAGGNIYAMHFHGQRHRLVYWCVEVNNLLVRDPERAARFGRDLGEILLEV